MIDHTHKGDLMNVKPDALAIERGTYHALLDVMDAAGYYPVSRVDILDSIRDGVRQAVAEYLAVNGLPT